MSEEITQACAAGARLGPAGAALGLFPAQGPALAPGGRRREHRTEEAVRIPANRLSPEERDEILEVDNQPEFAHLSPTGSSPALADQGRYLASEATFYRVLRAADQLAHRGRAKATPRPRP